MKVKFQLYNKLTRLYIHGFRIDENGELYLCIDNPQEKVCLPLERKHYELTMKIIED